MLIDNTEIIAAGHAAEAFLVSATVTIGIKMKIPPLDAVQFVSYIDLSCPHYAFTL